MSRKPKPTSLTEVIVYIALGCFLIGAVFGSSFGWPITPKEPSAVNCTATNEGADDDG